MRVVSITVANKVHKIVNPKSLSDVGRLNILPDDKYYINSLELRTNETDFNLCNVILSEEQWEEFINNVNDNEDIVLDLPSDKYSYRLCYDSCVDLISFELFSAEVLLVKCWFSKYECIESFELALNILNQCNIKETKPLNVLSTQQ